MKAVLIEDLPTDAQILVLELKRAGLDVEIRQVDSRNDFLAAMGDTLPDVILSDFSVPGFEGDESLELRNAHFRPSRSSLSPEPLARRWQPKC